jgi:predicted 3-demethylubiquinone-9 3-methyltransferase (glyoxalase superfamily)
MAHKITPQLMFEGRAGEAMDFYRSLFGGSAIKQVEYYGEGERGVKGTVKRAIFTLCGQDLACIDSPVTHAFSFTPSISLFVDCESEDELETLYRRLSEGGAVLMPPNNYGFSARFGWVSDRFGVSWQLNLA